MKKLLVVLFALVISLPSFAGLKEKNVVGKWTYTVETGQETLTGNMIFELKKGKLVGEVVTADGETYPLSNIEIKEGNILYFEIEPDYEVLKANLTVSGKKYEGTIGAMDNLVPMTGEKVK